MAPFGGYAPIAAATTKVWLDIVGAFIIYAVLGDCF